jgi:hypothetical protein
MKQEVKQGQTDYTILILVRDDSGNAKTGLAFGDIDLAYARVEVDNDVTTTDVAPADLAGPVLSDEHLDWGFLEVSAGDHPGLYRLDIADAVFASGSWSAVVSLVGAGLEPSHCEFVLTTEAPYSKVVPDAAGVVAAFIGANGANLTDLLTAVGFGTADAGDAMNLAADAIKAVSYDESTAFPLPAALTVANGAVDAKLTYIMDTILTETAGGRLAAAFIKLLDVAAPALTSASVDQGADNNTILAHSDYGNAKLVRATTPANKLDVNATGEVGLDFDNIKDATGAHTLTNITVPAVTNVTADVKGNVDGTVAGVTPEAAGVAPTAAEIKTAMEAAGSDLDYLINALVNQRKWQESDGDLEMFDDATSSLGTIQSQVATDGSFTTAKRAVI